MLKLEIPESKEKIKKYIKALKWQITQDVREEDKKIHRQALKDLEAALKKNN